jgi:hypothetical protein
MAVRIQLRRDTAANWIANNPVLRAGEFGVETDTLKVKVGNGTSTWNQITNYLNVTPSNLTTELSNYILASTKGQSSGVASLDSSSNLIIPGASIIVEGSTSNDFETTLTVTDPTEDRTITFPNASGTVAFTSDIPATTDGLTEGSTNKYFSDELAQDAVASALAAGTHTNITITYNDTSNAISFAAAPGYTDEEARDAVASMITESTHSGISVVYTDSGTSAGTLAFTNTGITSITGTTSEISVTSSSGVAVVSLPNNIVVPGTLTLNADPSTALQAATKQYVDSVAEGLHVHASVAAATTSNVSLSSPPATIDGVTLVEDMRILVKSQTTTSENGIYVFTDSSTLVRAEDYDTAIEIQAGDFVFVSGGDTYNNTGWVQENNVTTLGSDPIVWAQFSGVGTYAAGTGLVLTDNIFSISTSVVTLSGTQTLTNKTLTSPKINEDVALTSTATQLNYVSGVTSDIQTQLNSKSPSANPTFTGTVVLPSTTSIGDVSSTELGYLNNVTSAIQTQLDGKVDKSTVTTKGDLIVATTSATVTRIGVGTDGYLLTADSTSATGLSWLPAPVSLPDQTGNNGKYLTTNGTSASWATLVVPIETGTAVLDTNSTKTIDSIALSAFTSIEYLVSLKQDSKVRTSKVIMQTNGSAVEMTEYAITETGGAMSGVVISATTSGSNAILQGIVTNADTSNVNVKFSKIKL